MTRRQFVGLLAGAPIPLAAAPGSQSSLAITNATVIDGTGAVLADHTVLVANGRIAKLGQFTPPKDALVIDGRRKFLIPGLWDMHAHLSYMKDSALPLLLANGVTSIRDMGGRLSEIDIWRAGIDGGWRPGPRIVRAGPIVNGKRFNEFQIDVTTAAEARGAVRALQHAGVDFIKVHAAISSDAYSGIRDECKALKLPFAGHIPRAVTPEEVSDGGQITIEHISAIGERFARAGTPPDEVAHALLDFRKTKAPALFEKFAKNGTWFTPTLIASQTGMHLGRHKPDSRDRYIAQSCKKITADIMQRPDYREMTLPPAIERMKREFDELLPLVRLMKDSGVGLLTGSDFAISLIYPGFSVHEEMALLVDAGLTAAEAIATATRNPARMLGRGDIGTIEPGKLADMVLLDKDPLADIRNTQSIRAVITRGKLLDRTALDQLLKRAESEASES